jgi:hypothetical protein
MNEETARQRAAEALEQGAHKATAEQDPSTGQWRVAIQTLGEHVRGTGSYKTAE